MPVELRKRKAREPVPEPARPQKKTSKVAKATAKVKEVVTGKKTAGASKDANGTAPAAPAKAAAPTKAAAPAKVTAPAKGDVVDLDGFGGEVETQDGTKTTLKALVEQSKAGVVLFTYPKASTPGCTNQVCLFRDSYEPLTAGGLAIYGLSSDSPKANTTFKEKQKLPYPLLCDPSAGLIAAIGFKKSPKGTQRGVFVVDKAGKVLAVEPGSPAGTVEVVKKLVAAGGAPEAAAEAETTADPVPDAAAAAPAAEAEAEAAPASVEAPKVDEPVVEKKE